MRDCRLPAEIVSERNAPRRNVRCLIVLLAIGFVLLRPNGAAAQQLVSAFDVTLQPGVLQGYILGGSSETKAYVCEITPLEQQEVVIEKNYVEPEFDGSIWKDVLRVQLRATDPATLVNIRVYDISDFPIYSSFATTLEPGVLHGFLLGACVSGGAYVPEISPITQDAAVIERCSVQPEYNGSVWNDVLRVQTTVTSPSLDVQIRIYNAGGSTALSQFDVTLHPGVLQGYQLGPSAGRRWYVPDISPQTAAEAVFEKILVQPEYNASTNSWNDVLRIMTVAGGPTVQTTVRILAVQTPPALAAEHDVVPTFLATPVGGCSRTVPVLMILYLPTRDGVNLDVSIDPDFYSLNPVTIAQLKSDIITFTKRCKFALEHGSQFRAYGTPVASPFVGYSIVDIISVYETAPPGRIIGYSGGYPVYDRDYQSIFARFDVGEYVDEEDVREIWFWGGGMDMDYPSYDPDVHSPVDFRRYWESNMRSPITTDISNSDRYNNDLPLYDHTYVVYSYNFRRSQAEAIHNHGHQIEQMLAYVNWLQDGNDHLFWRKFVGQDEYGNFITGRCGWTHMPPNTVDNYDYLDPALVESDIADWTPYGTGSTRFVNVNTWGDIVYAWPDGIQEFAQRIETQWYIYWMQSIPGLGSMIPYGSNFVTNWWVPIVDWDYAITNGYGLYASTPSEADAREARCLVQNYPNPFNPFTTIAISVPSKTRVRMTIYDTAGRRVRVLVDGTMWAGRHQIVWNGCDDDGRHVSSGIYYCRLIAGMDVQTKKLVLLR